MNGAEVDYPGEFADKRLRNIFVRNVYAVLTVTNGLSLSIAVLLLYTDIGNSFLRNYWWIIFSTSLFVFVIVYLTLCCCCRQATGRLVPWNYLLLLVMYGALSSTVACTSQSYDSSGHVLLLTTWLYVFIAVTFVTLIANLFPCDHNHLLKYLLCIMWPVVGVSWFVTYLTLANVFVRFRSGQLGLGLAFAVVYTAYLAMNTQHIASNQEEDLSVDEYGYAAIVLAVDVMNVSLFMVTVYDVID